MNVEVLSILYRNREKVLVANLFGSFKRHVDGIAVVRFKVFDFLELSDVENLVEHEAEVARADVLFKHVAII